MNLPDSFLSFFIVVLCIVAAILVWVLVKIIRGKLKEDPASKPEEEVSGLNKDCAATITVLLKALFPDAEIKTSLVVDFWGSSSDITLRYNQKVYVFKLDDDGITICRIDEDEVCHDLEGKMEDLLSQMIIDLDSGNGSESGQK